MMPTSIFHQATDAPILFIQIKFLSKGINKIYESAKQPWLNLNYAAADAVAATIHLFMRHINARLLCKGHQVHYPRARARSHSKKSQPEIGALIIKSDQFQLLLKSLQISVFAVEVDFFKDFLCLLKYYYFF
jgi:hypothetical protein